MKLKKIASLALAGILAVSMLAGCGDNSGSKGEGTVVVNDLSSAVVNAMNNDAEYTDKDLKITFTYNSTLENELKSALSGKAENASADDVQAALELINGENDDDVFNITTGTDKQVIANQYVVKRVSTSQLNENMLLNSIVTAVEKKAAKLVATTKSSSLDEDDPYYDYTYTGDVAVVTVQAASGVTYYYVAFTIEQTTAKMKFEV